MVKATLKHSVNPTEVYNNNLGLLETMGLFVTHGDS